MDRRDDGAKPGKKPTSTLRRNLNTNLAASQRRVR